MQSVLLNWLGLGVQQDQLDSHYLKREISSAYSWRVVITDASQYEAELTH